MCVTNEYQNIDPTSICKRVVRVDAKVVPCIQRCTAGLLVFWEYIYTTGTFPLPI